MNMLKSLSLIVLLAQAVPALAFDDQRQGLILGLGAGLHTINEHYTNNGTTLLSSSASGLATSFKLGAGISDRLSIYYVRNISWFSAPYGTTGGNTTYTIGLSGVGATIYMAPTAPSAYVMGAVGSGDISTPFKDTRAKSGSAIMFGAGYEFKKHLMVEATLLSTNVPSGSLNLKSSALQFTFDYLFY